MHHFRERGILLKLHGDAVRDILHGSANQADLEGESPLQQCLLHLTLLI